MADQEEFFQASKQGVTGTRQFSEQQWDLMGSNKNGWKRTNKVKEPEEISKEKPAEKEKINSTVTKFLSPNNPVRQKLYDKAFDLGIQIQPNDSDINIQLMIDGKTKPEEEPAIDLSPNGEESESNGDEEPETTSENEQTSEQSGSTDSGEAKTSSGYNVNNAGVEMKKITDADALNEFVAGDTRGTVVKFYKKRLAELQPQQS